jgi:ubiquinone/menaquinone biosynthesis C-methylase UbiE
MSLNVIQYERNLNDVKTALSEYSRVLKKNGDIILITVAPKHYSYLKAKKIYKNVYSFRKWHFIENQIFFYFDSKIYLKSILKKYFKNIEIGTSFENLMGTKLEYFLVRAKKK